MSALKRWLGIHFLLNFRKWESKEKHRLFREDEYAKLGSDEKDLSCSWDFWNHSSPSF